jgi:putative transposase
MSTYRPKYLNWRLFHIYNRGNRKRKIFYKDRDFLRFTKLLRRYSAVHQVIVCGYCLMPNHYHLLLKQSKGGSIPKFMQGLAISHTKYMNTRYDMVGHVFQGRYQAREIGTESSKRRIVAYLKNNPVKDNLVEEPGLYRWLEIRGSTL